jgi:hypothetical protein
MILEPGMMQPNEFPKKDNDSGAQNGATHINSVRMATILETRMAPGREHGEKRKGSVGAGPGDVSGGSDRQGRCSATRPDAFEM